MTQTTPDAHLSPTVPENDAPNVPVTGSTEKHGTLFGGALTDEVSGSSRRVLHKPPGNKKATNECVTA